MILETAKLNVIKGQEAAFEKAMHQAKLLIQEMNGFMGMEVRHSMETPNEYLLLVWWDQLTDHTEGFRCSSEYEQWRYLLHQFYDPFPKVAYYEEAFVKVAPPA